MACFGGIGFLGCNGNLAWFLDRGASWHMTGMRNVFLSYSELGSRNYVGCGVSTSHVLAVRGVGSVKFQLESRGYLELVEVLYVPKLLINILSVLGFEMDRCGLVFHDGLVYLYLDGVSCDTKVFLGVRSEILYMLVGGPVVVGSRGWLDLEPNSSEASVGGP